MASATDARKTDGRRPTVLAIAGLGLLAYAVAGNYVALPGYVRFLERGGTSEAGNAFDIAVLWGAARTVLWMVSFQLGVTCLAAAHAIRRGLAVRPLLLFVLAWLVAWAWPSLPAPGPWFYIGFGSLILGAIAALLLVSPGQKAVRERETLSLGAIIFFAFATWEVCGLGSTGRMLHPEQAAAPMAHNILVTQSTKLMIEFLIAWSLLLLSRRPDGRALRRGD